MKQFVTRRFILQYNLGYFVLNPGSSPWNTLYNLQKSLQIQWHVYEKQLHIVILKIVDVLTLV